MIDYEDLILQKQELIEIWEDEPEYEPETQNSNFTFEKDECAKEYEELGLKELKELINADGEREESEQCQYT